MVEIRSLKGHEKWIITQIVRLPVYDLTEVIHSCPAKLCDGESEAPKEEENQGKSTASETKKTTSSATDAAATTPI